MAKENRHYTNWVRKFSGVVGRTSKDVLSAVTPNIVSTVDSAADSLRSARMQLSRYKSGMNFQSRTLETTRMGRSARDIMESAFADIRNGTFSLKNLSDESFNPDIDFNESDDSQENQAESSSTKNAVILSKVIAEGNAAQIEGMGRMTETLASVTAKSTHAAASKISNITLYGINKIGADLALMQRSLNTINSNLVEIIRFQNQNISVANQAALKYYQDSTNMLNEIGKSISALADTMENMKKIGKGRRNRFDEFDVSGGFDFRRYGDFIKKNFQNSLIGSYISLIGSVGGMNSSLGGGLGRSLITQMLASALIPSSIKKSLGSLDRNTDRYIRNLLYKLGDLGDYSNPNVITQFIGEVFGMKRPKASQINMSDFKKDYMGWNGVAQKTLVEVIPSYLANIEATLTRQEKRYYDMNKGVFRTESKIADSFMKEYQSKIEFGMMEIADRIVKELNKTGRSDADKERALNEISQIINDRILGTRKNDRHYSERMHSLLSGISTRELREIMLDLEDKIRDTIDSINDMNRAIEDEISGSVYRNLFNVEGIDRSDLRKRANIFKHDKYSRTGRAYSSMTEDEIMRDIKERETEAKFKNFGKGLRNRFLRRKGPKGSRFQWAADRVEDFDNFLYTMYSKISNGDMSFDNFKKMFRSRRTDESVLDSDIESTQKAMESFSAETISSMSDSEARSAAKETGRIMSRIKKISESSTGPDAKTKDEAFIKMANEGSKNTKTLQALVAGLFKSLSSIAGGIFGKNGIISKFFHSEKVQKGITILKQKLFDEKTGLFAPLVRIFKDGVDYIKYVFTGKGFTNRKGKKFKDNDESVFSYLKSGYDFIFKNTMKHLFGENFEENKTYQKYFRWMDIGREKRESESSAEPSTPEEKLVQDKIFGESEDTGKVKSNINALQPTLPSVREEVEAKILDAAEYTAEKIKTAGDDVTSAIFGDESEDKEATQKKVHESFFSKFKKNLPKMFTAGLIGGAVGLLGSFSGLGLIGSLFLPSGPIGGIIAGMGIQLASKSQRVQEFIFGKDDGQGNRTGGLISQKTTETFKKLLPAIVGGATLGALKKVVFGGRVVGGPGGFLLNALLPGGILGGALMGAGISMLKNSETFRKILFGKKSDEDGDNSQIKNAISRGFSKVKGAFGKSAHFIKGGIKGLIIGALGGLALDQLGLIGSALSIGGPIGMGIIGLGVGIASQTQRFQELLFGTREIGPDGKPTGKVFKDGLMHQVRNMLVINVFEPVKESLKKEMTKFAYWAKDKIMYPFRLAFGPLLDSFKDFKDDLGDFVKEKFEKITDGIGSALKDAIQKLFSPFTRLLGMVGR